MHWWVVPLFWMTGSVLSLVSWPLADWLIGKWHLCNFFHFWLTCFQLVFGIQLQHFWMALTLFNTYLEYCHWNHLPDCLLMFNCTLDHFRIYTFNWCITLNLPRYGYIFFPTGIPRQGLRCSLRVFSIEHVSGKWLILSFFC